MDEVRSRVVSDQTSVPVITMAPNTDMWGKIALRSLNLNHWEAVWRAAILGAILTHLDESRELLGDANRALLDKLKKELPDDLFSLGFARHPFAVVNILSAKFDSLNDAGKTQRLHASIWDSADAVIRRCAGDEFPDLYICIDNFDNYFDNAPTLMAAVQGGLALYLLRQAQDPLAGTRIRVHAAVRHTTRYFIHRTTGQEIMQPGFVEVIWTRRSISEVLFTTLEEYFGNGLADSIIVTDGFVDVPMRQSREAPGDYFLRHTTLTPRAARQVAFAVIAAHSTRPRELSSIEVRTAVAQHAMTLAQTTIHHMIGDMRALGGKPLDGFRVDDSQAIQHRALQDEFIRIVERAGTDLLSRQALQNLVEGWDEITRPYFSDCLWSHRLIGKLDRSTGRFLVSRGLADNLSVGTESDLLLHPILLDVCKIDALREAVSIGYV